MPLYDSKAAFVASDMKACPMPPSDPSCPICREDLQPHEPEAISTGPTVDGVQNDDPIPNSSTDDHDTTAANSAPVEPNEDHSPVKVTCCNNIFGRSCLEAWLTRGTSCPFCRAEFFPPQTVPTGRWFDWFARGMQARTDVGLEAARARSGEGMQATHARYTEMMDRITLTHVGNLRAQMMLEQTVLQRTFEALQQAGPDVELPDQDDAEDESDSMPELEPLDEMEGYYSGSGSVLSEDEDDESEFEDEDEDEDGGDEDGGGDGPPEGPGSGGAVCVACAHTGASVRA
ncbi:hypothetical protein J4E83_004288 [Alternaria metachromatica]|uniref:uncharacterized protein n=1 Tax=Alternaria metachromatica TaxID=283354 RepID=UPI0020C3B6ED|nr:uncharacterized protein J4E83_004288 [Alternaria metachromatica]KAI4624612.1 hypothetical protein J4E83_004288 [Alternaria metachromatica]